VRQVLGLADLGVIFLGELSLTDYIMTLSWERTAKHLVQAGGHIQTALLRVRSSQWAMVSID